MKKSLGLAALCALISPSIALAQESASVDMLINLQQKGAPLSVSGVSDLNFGSVLIPRSNGSAAAQCKFEILPADGSVVVVDATTIDPDGALVQSCEAFGQASYATFAFVCNSLSPVSLGVSFQSDSTTLFLFEEDANIGFGESEPDFNLNANNVDCASLSNSGITQLFSTATLIVNIKAVEDDLFSQNRNLDYTLGAVTMSADF